MYKLYFLSPATDNSDNYNINIINILHINIINNIQWYSDFDQENI